MVFLKENDQPTQLTFGKIERIKVSEEVGACILILRAQKSNLFNQVIKIKQHNKHVCQLL